MTRLFSGQWLLRSAAAISILISLFTLRYLLSDGTLRDIASRHSSAYSEPAPRWAPKGIPDKHWQIWKVNIGEFEEKEMECMRTWRQKNPFHRYEVFSHQSAETFVRQSFQATRQDIVDTFFAVKDNVIRADFFRYLVLYHEGGVYSDIDTKALRPINTWIPCEYKNSTNVVIGLEIDEPGVMWADWTDNFSFCQSTLMTAAKHRIYELLISRIISELHTMSDVEGKAISNLEFSYQQVINITGPGAFTDAVLLYLSEETGEAITRANFSMISAPKHMADVLVLPTVAFVPGQAHSRSGTPEDEEALVQHMFMGSWKSQHKLNDEK